MQGTYYLKQECNGVISCSTQQFRSFGGVFAASHLTGDSLQ